MNRKGLFAAASITILFASLFIGIAASNKLQNTQYVSYRFDAVLSNPVATITATPPIIHVEGYRPPSGIQNCSLTINGVQYTYPNDFNYTETFTVESNQITNTSTFVVTTIFTFNLQGNPTITEWMTQQATQNGTLITTKDGTFFLSGTGIFDCVGGGGFVESTGNATTRVDYAHHIGLIENWPI